MKKRAKKRKIKKYYYVEDKNKENTLLKDVTKIAEMPIIDDDIILKRCAVNDPEKRRKRQTRNS